MTKYVINGGRPLYGEVEISGAKNAAVAIIPAALMVDGICRIENLPNISDVTTLLNILREMGAEVRTINKRTIDIDCSRISTSSATFDMMRRIRASYYLIGALLGRFGRADVSMPGGKLKLCFDDDFNATMSGAVQKIGDGEIDSECFA